jgi:hypothetical protein
LIEDGSFLSIPNRQSGLKDYSKALSKKKQSCCSGQEGSDVFTISVPRSFATGYTCLYSINGEMIGVTPRLPSTVVVPTANERLALYI